jgi:hypothetical protein
LIGLFGWICAQVAASILVLLETFFFLFIAAHNDQSKSVLTNKSSGLVLSFLLGACVQRSGCLGSTLAVMKKSSKFLPVVALLF